LQQLLEATGGLLVLVVILFDIFLTVVVPRRAPRAGQLLRISGFLVPGL
jgi:hypothetical protein